MIKKIVLLLIMVMMLSQFVACGSNTKQIEQKENMKQSEEQTQERTNENIQEEKELEADKSYPHIFNATKLKCCNNKNDLDKFLNQTGECDSDGYIMYKHEDCACIDNGNLLTFAYDISDNKFEKKDIKKVLNDCFDLDISNMKINNNSGVTYNCENFSNDKNMEITVFFINLNGEEIISQINFYPYGMDKYNMYEEKIMQQWKK